MICRLMGMTVGCGLLLTSLAGCGSSPSSPAQQFVLDQTGINTPHGQIDPASVRDIEGVIQYQTSNGKFWTVSWRRLPDGTREYGTPEEVSPAAE